jgi:hypothetical protein
VPSESFSVGLLFFCSGSWPLGVRMSLAGTALLSDVGPNNPIDQAGSQTWARLASRESDQQNAIRAQPTNPNGAEDRHRRTPHPQVAKTTVKGVLGSANPVTDCEHALKPRREGIFFGSK